METSLEGTFKLLIWKWACGAYKSKKKKKKKSQYDSQNGQGKDFTWCQKRCWKEKIMLQIVDKDKELYILKSYDLMQNMTMSNIENISASMDT